MTYQNNNLDLDLKLDLEFYNYVLPPELISQSPNENRENAKLLVANGRTGEIKHDVFNNIYNYFDCDSLLVMNSTKVIPARFFMKKQTGGQVELLCVASISPTTNPQIALTSVEKCTWECIIGGRNVSVGMMLNLVDKFTYQNNLNLEISATVLKRYENKAHIEFVWNSDSITFGEIINIIGKTPLPPYIRREANLQDTTYYQTVYAKTEGSVAAPTAGLHFTKDILNKIIARNIKIENVTLHIGPGTFVPIETSVELHKMHSEQIFIERKTIERLAEEYKNPDKFIIATGTTSLRTLETFYWLGVKSLLNEFDYSNNFVFLEQEYAYLSKNRKIKENFKLKIIFEALLEQFDKYKTNILECKTQLFIHPPYEINTADALITNFHLPKSTLLLLVASFVGNENLMRIYNEAINNKYKFLSYGDSSLLFNKTSKLIR